MHGRTFCRDIVRKDYEICKQGNANFVRLCHYPHDLKEYEIASEMGFLAIAEVPNVNFKKEQFQNPELMELAINQLKETIKYYKNETCIMFWSLFIECKTYEDAAVDFVPNTSTWQRSWIPAGSPFMRPIFPNRTGPMNISTWSASTTGSAGMPETTIEGGSALLDRIAPGIPTSRW